MKIMKTFSILAFTCRNYFGHNTMCNCNRPSKNKTKQKQLIVACVVTQSDHMMSVKPHNRKVFLSGPTHVVHFHKLPCSRFFFDCFIF